MDCVLISSSRSRVPVFERNPTMIFGTPSRNDWIQNLSNLRSNFRRSLSDWISSEVFSSTQLIGCVGSSGFRSHTAQSETLDSDLNDENMQKAQISPASTSPPRIRLALPMPVCTTEQYCCALSTICLSRFSMYSLETASHTSGMRDSASNLYPIVLSASYRHKKYTSHQLPQ
jgi:hypothetical protein